MVLITPKRKKLNISFQYEAKSKKSIAVVHEQNTETRFVWEVAEADGFFYGCIFKKDEKYVAYYGPSPRKDIRINQDWFATKPDTFENCIKSLLSSPNETTADKIKLFTPYTFVTEKIEAKFPN